ncbi:MULTISPECIES: hypothetical protein [Mammaliicoccus]|uniref:Phage protein n=1 Tax=Mammaliicoccus sciuri TaxID=1296 RepID=A0AAW5LIY0_MAMSC|nr:MULTISPECIES: hypothetical protein [Mammaliicoccus]MCD5141237.1 hypothetical protein [Mammaliicoccus sciuri]MCQ9302686.1 hypothetical protein [Mammaliicoccus sciuri]MDO0950210.1 hypothetical protein [Mammaliicoccus sciuri]MDT0746476.1 hypothetical protein [Mammaliicoccus sciuri]MDT0751406.1 hypothetical protein [Mammaliicoccus sciuri]
MYTPSEVRQIITDYNWMKNIIDSKVYENDSTSIGQYGIESSMPKAQGTTGDKVLVRVLRNDKEYRKHQELIDKMAVIDDNEELITNNKDYHILQLLKQGEKHKRIMSIMKVGRDNFYDRLRDIVMILSNAQYDRTDTSDTSYTSDSIKQTGD